jgi:hypothetical protein
MNKKAFKIIQQKYAAVITNIETMVTQIKEFPTKKNRHLLFHMMIEKQDLKKTISAYHRSLQAYGWSIESSLVPQDHILQQQ